MPRIREFVQQYSGDTFLDRGWKSQLPKSSALDVPAEVYHSQSYFSFFCLSPQPVFIQLTLAPAGPVSGSSRPTSSLHLRFAVGARRDTLRLRHPLGPVGTSYVDSYKILVQGKGEAGVGPGSF